MPRFFFDIHDGPSCTLDRFGDDLTDFEEARDHAQALLADVMHEELPDGEERVFVCEVRDDAGDIIYRCRLRLHGERLRDLAKAVCSRLR